MTNERILTRLPASSGGFELSVDVLVIGGGPAGTWAGIAAAKAGASVVLVDKGFVGSSGATAPSGTGIWYVEPRPDKRLEAMNSRWDLGGHLADRRWMARVLDRTYDNVNELAQWGYPFPTDEHGISHRTSVQGPEYMRLMRKRAKSAGVKILDHSPALELLVDESGTVSGAAGIRRQKGDRWVVRAGAVVMASGGCAFLSKALGCNVLTGDGYLMGAEVGADLEGMEFSNAYAISPAFSSVTKTMFYGWASFTFEDGTQVPGAASKGGRSAIARALEKQAVFAQIDQATADEQYAMRHAQPNFFVPFDRAGIDPFNQRFPITLRLEGTVRGTGGLRIVDDTCATAAPGLYAAGDAATRGLICGGFTGGGSHNAAWAMSSGFWAGAGAADFAKSRTGSTDRPAYAAGTVGLREGKGRAIDSDAVTARVQAEVFDYNTNYFRHGDRLSDSLRRLDHEWEIIRDAGEASFSELQKTRESAAMTATARWMYRSALARTESRGMHRREEFREKDPNQRHYLVSGGLDEVWVTPRAAPALPVEELAA